MNDNKKTGQKGGVAAQPMDPTRSGEDFLGDTTGLTGVTTGSAVQTSATPKDTLKDANKDHLPGGIQDTNTNQDHGRRLSPEFTNTESYDKQTLQGASHVMSDTADDLASEEETAATDVSPKFSTQDETPYTINKQNASGDDSPHAEDINTEQAPFTQPSNEGQQSVSGSESDPTADDDTLEVAHAAGIQMNEDDSLEHPKEIDLARDIDQAEKDIREK